MNRCIKLYKGCVRDMQTGLEWTPTLNPDDPVTFADAQKLAAECDLLGGGWRMPPLHELQSIVDYSRFDPAVDTDVFPDTQPSWYWTDTVDASSPSDCAWLVHFLHGRRVNIYLQDFSGLVRAVRSYKASA